MALLSWGRTSPQDKLDATPETLADLMDGMLVNKRLRDRFNKALYEQFVQESRGVQREGARTAWHLSSIAPCQPDCAICGQLGRQRMKGTRA